MAIPSLTGKLPSPATSRLPADSSLEMVEIPEKSIPRTGISQTLAISQVSEQLLLTELTPRLEPELILFQGQQLSLLPAILSLSALAELKSKALLLLLIF